MRHVTRYSHRIFTFQRESCLWLPSIHTSASMAAGCCLIISLVIFSKHARFIIRWELSSSTRFRLSTATVAASYIESFLSRPIIQRKPFKLGKLMIRNSSIIPMMITMMCDASGTNFYFAIASDVLICSTRKYCSSFGALPIWLAFCQTRTRRMLSRHVQIFKIIHWNDVVFVDIYNIVWCKRGFIVSFLSIYAHDSRNLILLSHTIYFDRWIPELHTIHFNANYATSGISLEYETRWSQSQMLMEDACSVMMEDDILLTQYIIMTRWIGQQKNVKSNCEVILKRDRHSATIYTGAINEP